MMFIILLLASCAVNIQGVREGGVCTHANVPGVCTEVSKCASMLEDPIIRKLAPSCQSHGSADIVCCNVGTTTPIQEESCEPLPASMTSTKTGSKAWDKCVGYQQLVFPCRDGKRVNECPHNGVVELIVDGNTHAKRHEFPHAVLLGYTNDKQELDWLCGGTLVSDRFVLTAGICAYSRSSGSVTYVALQPTDRANIEPDTLYKVKSIVRHPEFKPPKTYHDIALLELEQPVPLSSTTVPACLVLDGAASGSEEPEEPSTVTATTWNTHDKLGNGITLLRKIPLVRYSMDECSRLYPESRRGGYNATTQLCYGDQRGAQARDICQDDGGNPLVVESKVLSCMYSVLGVASYGKGCFTHSPGVYTRVRHYLPWIESVVWP